MKEDVAEFDEIKSTLEKHQTDLINKLDSLNLSAKDYKMAMEYMEKGKKMAANIAENTDQLSYFADSVENAKNTEDIMQTLANLFKQEFIKSEGNDAKDKLNTFCKAFDSQEAQQKLQEYDKDTKNALLKMIEVLSSKE